MFKTAYEKGRQDALARFGVKTAIVDPLHGLPQQVQTAVRGGGPAGRGGFGGLLSSVLGGLGGVKN